MSYDLASGALEATKTVTHLYAGDHSTQTDSAPAAVADIVKYELCAITAAGLVKFVPGTHTADQAVVAAQPSLSVGANTPFFKDGCFNHEMIVWPAGTALDTYAERRAFFGNRPLCVGKLAAGGTSAS